MNRLTENLAREKGFQIGAIIARADVSADEIAAEIKGCDAAIDFSSAEAVVRNAKACLAARVPLVEGTTGWNAEKDSIKKLVEDADGAFVFGANFSVGVNLFYRAADFATEMFARFDEYEVFIEERHHSRKKDAPSGTALKLKEITARHFKNDFSVTATRAGHIPGTHLVGFDSFADTIELRHTARSREGFARGALVAAQWICGRKGFYEFTQVMDEIINKNEPQPL